MTLLGPYLGSPILLTIKFHITLMKAVQYFTKEFYTESKIHTSSKLCTKQIWAKIKKNRNIK